MKLPGNYTFVTAVIWALIVLMFWLQRLHTSTLEESLLYLTIFIPMIAENTFLANYILPRTIRSKKTGWFIVCFLAGSILVSLAWAGIFMIGQHIHAETDSKGFLYHTISSIPSAVVFNLAFCGLRLYHEHTTLQRLNLEMQQASLKAQITPHFMFNVLNHIHTLMHTDVDKASDLLIRYSDLLRYQLYRSKADKVPLKEEVAFLKNFIEIEKVRRGDRVTITQEWDIEDENAGIEPDLLFGLVENAFKYAAQIPSGQAFIDISFHQEHGLLRLHTSNSVMSGLAEAKAPDKDTHRTYSGLGLENIRQRLDLLYPGKWTLVQEEKEDIFHSQLTISTK